MSRPESREGRGKWIVGGVGLAALLYFLTRGGDGVGLGAGSGVGDTSSRGPSASPCRVRIDQRGLELDGAPADLATTVTRCRAAGTADVTATGAAIVGTIAEVVRALREAGVTVRASSSVWDAAAVVSPRPR